MEEKVNLMYSWDQVHGDTVYSLFRCVYMGLV